MLQLKPPNVIQEGKMRFVDRFFPKTVKAHRESGMRLWAAPGASVSPGCGDAGLECLGCGAFHMERGVGWV